MDRAVPVSLEYTLPMFVVGGLMLVSALLMAVLSRQTPAGAAAATPAVDAHEALTR